MLNKKSVDDINVKGKKVLVRCDFNVPLDAELNITDENRLVAALPTINKLIADGGISSKNSPNYSIESFLIANKKRDIFGIKVDLYQTKDNVLILLDDEVKTKLGIDDFYIKAHNYEELKKLNFGNKVKKHSIITLIQLINIINKQNNIILNITSDVDTKILEPILNTNQKINWYLASYSLDVLDQLSYKNIKNKLGIIIKEPFNLNLSFDFYIIEKNQLENKQIKENLINLNKIFITNIFSKAEIKINNKENIFFISKHINKLHIKI